MVTELHSCRRGKKARCSRRVETGFFWAARTPETPSKKVGSWNESKDHPLVSSQKLLGPQRIQQRVMFLRGKSS